jgi:hypothetical protein
MQPYRDLLHGARPTFESQHLRDLALFQLCALVMALAVVAVLGG